MEFDTEFTDSVATTIFVNKEDQNRIEKADQFSMVSSVE